MSTSVAASVSVLRMGYISSQVGKGFLPSTSAESLLHLTDFLRGRLDRFVLVNNLMAKHMLFYVSAHLIGHGVVYPFDMFIIGAECL